MIKELHKEVGAILKTVTNHSKFKMSHRLYQDRLVVIDFKDNYLSLGMDIGFVENNSHKLFCKTIFRNVETKRLFEQQKESIIDDIINRKELNDYLIEIVNRIVSSYDSLYKYKVSIVVPTYNRAGVMGKLLNSINNQTYDKSKFEVIFVDDCSSDDSVEIIEKLLDSDINYKIYKLPINSGGASIPRNLGIRASCGEYIFFVDSDDNIFPYTLKDCVSFIEETNCDVLYVKMISSSGRKVATRPFRDGKNVKKADFLSNHLSRSLNPIKFYRNSLIRTGNIHFPNIKSNEDRIFTLSVLCNAKNVSIMGDKAYYDADVYDDLSVTKTAGLSIDEYMMIIRTFFNIIDGSNMGYVQKLKVFNGIMSIIFDWFIAWNNKYDIDDYVKKVLRDINALGFVICKNYIYPEYDSILSIFKKYDIYGVIK